MPLINAALSHKHVGVRYAACQSVRALSRSVAAVRTSIIDSDLGMSLYEMIFMKPDEDRRVTYASMLAVCNLVTESSPLREVSFEIVFDREGGVEMKFPAVLEERIGAKSLAAPWHRVYRAPNRRIVDSQEPIPQMFVQHKTFRYAKYWVETARKVGS